jgi:ParB-like chromosome segregation protein Spo0J
MKKIDFKIAMQEKSKSIPDSLLEAEEKIKRKIIIIAEIRDFISPLNQEELSGLEQSLLADGITDPIILWEVQPSIAGIVSDQNLVYVLIDGHHRFGIAQKHNLDFRVVIKKYSSLADVKDAMIDKQLNRRNLTQEQISYYRGLKYASQKTIQGGVGKLQNVALEMAKMYGVNEKTIRRDGYFAEGIDKLSPEFKQQVLTGLVKIPKATLTSLSSNEAIVEPIKNSDEINNFLGKTNHPSDSSSNPKHVSSTQYSIQSYRQYIRQTVNNNFSKSDCLLLIDALQSLSKLL